MQSRVVVPTGSDYRLPGILALPLRLLPGRAHSGLMAVVVNRLFRDAFSDGELDFLCGRVLRVTVLDAGVHYGLVVRDGRLRVAPGTPEPALWIEGNLCEFLRLAAGYEDPDTLFFSRRLRLGGDTELGVYLKNVLDAHTLDPALAPLRRAAQHLLALLGIHRPG